MFISIVSLKIITNTSLIHRSVVLTKILHKNPPTVWRLKEGSNLNYVIMAVDEHDELPEATQREAELQDKSMTCKVK